MITESTYAALNINVLLLSVSLVSEAAVSRSHASVHLACLLLFQSVTGVIYYRVPFDFSLLIDFIFSLVGPLLTILVCQKLQGQANMAREKDLPSKNNGD